MSLEVKANDCLHAKIEPNVDIQIGVGRFLAI